MDVSVLQIPIISGTSQPSEAMSGVGDEQQRLADIMSETWLAFARTGNPNNATLPEWPEYDAARRATMILDLPPRVVDDPRGEERRLFKRQPKAASTASP